MAQVRVPLVVGIGGIQAAVPSFSEVKGSYQPIVAGKVNSNGVLAGVSLGDPALQGVTVLVDVPDDEVNPDGSLNAARIRAKYPDHFLTRQGKFG